MVTAGCDLQRAYFFVVIVISTAAVTNIIIYQKQSFYFSTHQKSVVRVLIPNSFLVCQMKH